MRKLLFLILISSSLFAQDPWDWFGKNTVRTISYPLPDFAIDTTQVPLTPYSLSWLYFAGAPSARGQFVKHLGSNDAQYGLGLTFSTTDSFRIILPIYIAATARSIIGKFNGGTGWLMAVGNSLGANRVEWYMSGSAGNIDVDTVAGDTTWHTYDIRYWKATTTLDIYVDGVRHVHNTSYTYTSNQHSHSFALGMYGALNTVADTGMVAGTYFKGGIKPFTIIRYSGGRDTTYSFQMAGYGQNVYCNVTSNGTYVKGWYDFDRSGYSGVFPMTTSPHMTLGLYPSNDPKDPLWINTGTAPSWIVPLGYGVRNYAIALGAAMNDESFTNMEAPYKTNFTGQGESTFVVIGGRFNTINQSNPVTMGDSAFYMAKYNINTGIWTSFKNSQMPNTSIYGGAQWDSSLVVAGSQDSFKTVLRTKGVARWDGTNWSSLDSGINGIGVRVRVIDDTCYLGGSFTASGNTTLNNVGRIARGGEWRSFGTGTSGLVYDFAKYNGSLYVGGLFENANGVTVNSIGRWNGTTFEALGRGLKLKSGAIGIVYCMAVYKNELYIGGVFDSANGVPCKSLVKFDGTNFTAVASFTMGTQGSDVIEMVVDSTYNHLYGVGQFTRINGRTARAGFVYDGTNIVSFHAGDMRPEGFVICNNQTANIRYFMMGDYEGVYGKNISNINEIIPPR